MAFIDLPVGCVADYKGQLVPRAARSRSAFGTGGSNISRLGRHWQCEVRLHKMLQDDAIKWDSRLSNDTGDGHRWTIPQGNLISGPEGAPLVAGANQQGTTLNIDGAAPGLVIPEGAFVSTITNGRRYVQRMAAQVTVSGGGTAALTFTAPMRVIPGDNNVVEIKSPKVEGLIEDFDGLSVSVTLARYITDGATFIIRERG